MKQVPAEISVIAWFKLADYVSRGEKERALNLYQLLKHSIDDHALKHQLAGDLCTSFNDVAALRYYEAAAEIYHKEGRLVQSAALYERLYILRPLEGYLQLLLELYRNLGFASHLDHTIVRCCSMYDRYEQAERCQRLVNLFEQLVQTSIEKYLLRHIVFAYLVQSDCDKQTLVRMVKTILENIPDDKSYYCLINGVRALDRDLAEQITQKG